MPLATDSGPGWLNLKLRLQTRRRRLTIGRRRRLRLLTRLLEPHSESSILPGTSSEISTLFKGSLFSPLMAVVGSEREQAPIPHFLPWPHRSGRTSTTSRRTPPSPQRQVWSCPLAKPSRHTSSSSRPRHCPLCSPLSISRPFKTQSTLPIAGPLSFPRPSRSWMPKHVSSPSPASCISLRDV